MELEEKLDPIDDTCCVKCYGGVNQLRALARRVPVVGMAVALEREKSCYSHLCIVLIKLLKGSEPDYMYIYVYMHFYMDGYVCIYIHCNTCMYILCMCKHM